MSIEHLALNNPAPTALMWTPHPLAPVPDAAEVEALLDTEEGRKALLEFYQAREGRIRQAKEEPYYFGFELPHWKDADEQLASFVELYLFLFGGVRSSKSMFGLKRALETCLEFREVTQFVMDESEKASVLKVQKHIWNLLPLEIKALNERRDPTFKIRYTQANGFSDGKLVFPNGSEMLFLNYSQDPKDYEGVELGVKREFWQRRKATRTGPNGEYLGPHNIGAFCDESMTLPWANLIEVRCLTRNAICLWGFAPVHGMTPTIKEKVGVTARTLVSRVAELLEPTRVHVEGCGPGEMPYLQETITRGQGNRKSRVMYFHTVLNPFAGYEGLKGLCQDKTVEYVEQHAYGYSRDTANRQFPNFGSVNVVKVEDLPETGTNYHFIDPAGSRPIASMWVRVTATTPARYYIYRDWPDERRFGEWATPSEDENTHDGDAGPAQRPLGLGYLKYKMVWLEEERVRLGQAGKERDPYRRRLVALGMTNDENPNNKTEWVQEEVFERWIDPRAARNAHIAEKGGTCLQDELAKESVNDAGEVVAPGMWFQAASGVDLEEGIGKVNDLLDWRKEQPLDWVMNAPRLFVSEECKQVIWAMQNWTNADGQKGACKDFVDLVRYMALAELVYVGGGRMGVKGGGSY